jgi:hypothetical protein
MLGIDPCPVPAASLLHAYLREGAHADCYVAGIERQVSHARYVEAFYTTALFKLERLILKWAAAKPSTDAEAKQLGDGTMDSFAAWRVEGRREDELLLCDFSGRTRSWLKTVPTSAGGRPGTRLYFGSAVVPRRNEKTGRGSLGFTFRALMPFHKFYSRALLHAAQVRLQARGD